MSSSRKAALRLGEIIAATRLDWLSKSPPRVATKSNILSSTSTPRSCQMLVDPIARASSFERFPPLSIAV